MSRKKSSSAELSEAVQRIAREGLAGIAREGEVGEFHSPRNEDGLWIVEAESTQPGYPGWLWTVIVTEGDDGRLTVTEVNLLPGETALLSPEWVPWSKRLEEYRRAEAEREASDLSDDDDHDDDDVDDDDVDDVLDGIDIDQLDLDLDPGPLEIPDDPNDVFDHMDVDDVDDDSVR